MGLRMNLIGTALLMILMLSFSICATSAYAQSIDVSVDFSDLQEIDKRLQNFEDLKKIAAKQTEQIEALTNALKIANDLRAKDAKEIELNDRVIAIKDQEIAAQARAIADLRDISDRALKLAEVGGKSNSIWTTIGLVLGGIVAGLAIAAAL